MELYLLILKINKNVKIKCVFILYFGSFDFKLHGHFLFHFARKPLLTKHCNNTFFLKISKKKYSCIVLYQTSEE